MRRIISIALAGCGRLAFEPIATDATSGVTDGLVDDASALDATPACIVDVNTGVDRGTVGGPGGNLGPTLDCGPQTHPVGIALRMSDQPTIQGTRSAHGLQLACARVAIDVNGIGSTGSTSTMEAVGTGTNGWAPSTFTPITQCQPGWILAGLEAHTGASNNSFSAVTMTCAKVGMTGAVLTTERVAVVGSLVEPLGIDEVICNVDEVVTALGTRIGSGFDAAVLSCATPLCL